MKFKISVKLCIIAVVAICASGNAQSPFELDELFSGQFSNRGFNGIWMTGDSFHYRDTTTRDVLRFNVETWRSEILFPASVLSNFTSASYTLSPDNNYVLIRYNPVSIFRHSTTAQFSVYDLTNE
ncbi:hypothetical protein QE152_g8527 [Popillia japonica]|uniref:Uncharacterized protein n=1 Tax=Popillia japonica TaxID=7064 RepID=A0AAW1M9G2_POPJA